MKHYSFPSIEQFNNVIRNVKKSFDYKGKYENGEPIYNHDKDYPTLKFKGTVKLHGTNAGIVFPTDNPKDMYCQSRERLIQPTNDNAGFACYIHALPEAVISMLYHPKTIIYGEWCGGNIQKGVGINGLPKMFVIFNILFIDPDTVNNNVFAIDSLEYFSKAEISFLNNFNIYHIEQFKIFNIDIDFNHPEIAQNELIRLTEEVEKDCPVARYFKPNDTDLIGEGIVWKPVDGEYASNSGYWFKCKGEKHQTSKVKTLAPIDVEEVKEIERLIDIVVTDNRVEQGMQKLAEMGLEVSVKSTGDFLRWMIGDIEKEDGEMLNKSGIDRKKIHKKVSEISRKKFMGKLNEKI